MALLHTIRTVPINLVLLTFKSTSDPYSCYKPLSVHSIISPSSRDIYFIYKGRQRQLNDNDGMCVIKRYHKNSEQNGDGNESEKRKYGITFFMSASQTFSYYLNLTRERKQIVTQPNYTLYILYILSQGLDKPLSD